MSNRQLLLRDQRQALLARYKQALDSLNNGQPESLLPVLFARDQAEQGRKQSLAFSDSQALTLLQLDEQLRQQASGQMRSALPSWRNTFDPPTKSWWWFLDQAVSKTNALDRYKNAINDLKKGQSETLLPVLLARDHVEKLLPPDEGLSLSFSDRQAKKLLELDEQVRQEVTGSLLEKFETLRMTCCPPDSHWWWFLDMAAQKREAQKHEAQKREAEKRETEKRDAENNLLWEVLTGTLLVLIFPLALDIIQRLWDGAPDGISIIGTLITLILTGSPLTKRGQEVARFLTERMPRFQARFQTAQTPRFQARFHHQAMAGMALLAFVVLLVIKFVGFSFLASYYNRQGLAAIDRNPTLARHNFQRVVALDAEMAVGYYHLGVVYEQIGQPEEASSWYQQAIEHQLDLGEAYSNLGRLYILQGNPQQALQVLHAGRIHSNSRTKEERFIRYKLLSNFWTLDNAKSPN